MSEDLNLGELIHGEQHRDAVHIAVAPVVLDHDMAVGAHVGLVPGTQDRVSTKVEPAVGIIDPFLVYAPKRGQKCWLFLYPGTVTSLRHHWTHSAFDDQPVQEEVTKPTRKKPRPKATGKRLTDVEWRNSWRTDDVIHLCETIRETEDYSSLPVLADALEEAGYDDEVILGDLRIENLHHIAAQRLVAKIYSDESAKAVEWMSFFADQYGTSYEGLVTGAVDGSGHCFGDTGGPEAVDDKFWDNLELITGKTFREEHRDNTYFRCAC